MITINFQIFPLSPRCLLICVIHTEPPAREYCTLHIFNTAYFLQAMEGTIWGYFSFESIKSLWSANKSVTLLVLEINRSNRIRSIDLLPNSLYLMISSPLETSVIVSVCVNVVVSASVASCKCVSNDQWWCCLSPSWSLGELSSLANNHHRPVWAGRLCDLKLITEKVL